MRAIIKRLPLLDALRAARAIIKSTVPKPVLRCVKLATTADASVRLEATDLELSFCRELREVQVEQAGAICVGCDDLTTVAAAATGDTMAFEVDKGQLGIRTASGRFLLPTLDAKDFPTAQADAAANADAVTIKADDFRRLIRQAAFACGEANSRYSLAGALLLVRGKKAVMVATDGKRLAIAEADAAGKANAPGWLLPDRFLATFDKVFDADGDLRLLAHQGTVLASDGHSTLRTVLIDGTFVPWEDVIPKDDTVRVRSDAGELLAAIGQVAPFAVDADGTRGRGCLTVDVGPAGISLAARSANFGQAEVSLPCKVEGGPLQIGAGADLLREGVRAAEGAGEVALHFTAPNRPMLMTAGNYRYVLMPRSIE